MLTTRRLGLSALIALCSLLVDARPVPAQVRVIISGGFSAAYGELLPRFEQSSGVTVTTTTGGSVGDGPNTIPNQLRRGVEADVIILAREGLAELTREHRIVPGTDTDLARSLIGVVIPRGAVRPDISTVDALKAALLAAPSVAVSSSTSGVYLRTTLFPKLGIADAMASKTSQAGAAAVGRGEAALGLQQVSEVLPIPNTEFVGRIPDAVQYVTTYAAAVVVGSPHVDAARRLIAFLASNTAASAIIRSGMEPASAARK